MVSKLTIFLSVFAGLILHTATSTSSEEDYFTYQYSSEGKQPLKQLLIQRALDPNAFEDNLSKFREAGLKRAHSRGEKIPPGFVGVRGKKLEKEKVKEPFPGFLGVRGKKSSGREQNIPNSSSFMDDIMIPLSRYIERDFYNFKGKKHH